MDNLKPGPSLIPHAGRGAFATRPIPSGKLVTPVPLIHIPDRAILEMHAIDDSVVGEHVRESDDLIGQQLLLNYVYGHRDSSMVFFPTGLGASFINHGAAGNANVKLVWSHHPANERDLFDLEPHELLYDENAHIALLLEVVATRDIAQGEEVFLDYGPEWEAAWQAHVEQWNKLVSAGDIPAQWPLRAVDIMDHYRTNVLKTEEELLADPYIYPETVIRERMTIP
jgi:hypothetical protein